MLKNELLFAIDANTYYSVVAVCTCNYLLCGKFDRCFDMFKFGSLVRDHHMYIICKYEILADFNFGSSKDRPPKCQT